MSNDKIGGTKTAVEDTTHQPLSLKEKIEESHKDKITPVLKSTVVKVTAEVGVNKNKKTKELLNVVDILNNLFL